jgi:LmbE family N-acetylglucosaminyl deacetylase
MKMNKVLIIAAHPDDDILGCGGLISKYRNLVDFRVIFIAEGSSCRYILQETTHESLQKVIDERNSFGKKALELLGIKNYFFYNLPCGRLDQFPILEINKIIETEINNFKPDTVFTHSFEDTNNDHIIVHRATQMATRPGSNHFVDTVFAYEVLSSSEWRFTHTFLPNHFEILSENDVNNKWLSLNTYESEVKEFPYPRSEEGVIMLAKYRGMQCGNTYAEAFQLIRKIKK